LLSRLPGEFGVFLAMTGWEMNGVDAHDLKIAHMISPVCPVEQVMTTMNRDLKIFGTYTNLEFIRGKIDR